MNRFQIKYENKDGRLHEIWQDPAGLYTTVFLGIDPATGCFVAADPVLHNPTLCDLRARLSLAPAQGLPAP